MYFTKNFKNMSFCLYAASFLAMSPAVYATKNKSEVTSEQAKQQLIQQVPELNNASHILIDFHSGDVLVDKNSRMQLPPASLTKMMTSYLFEQALTKGDVKETDMIPVSKSAECNRSKGESCMFLKAGKPATALDILRGIVIQSGNDASRAIAEHIGGNETKFVEMMNAEAQKLGLKDTHYENPTGMPAEDHYSTASDLAILAKAIIGKNSRYYPVYAEKEFTYAGIKQYNRNRLLFTGKSTDGLKTGHTREAGYCLVASAKRGDMRLISVILGTKSKQARTNQSRKLLNWGFDNYQRKLISPKNNFISKTTVWFAEDEKVNLGVGADLSVMMPKHTKGKVEMVTKHPDSLEAPLKKGQKVGEVSAVLDGKVLATAPIIVMQDVPEAGFFSRMWDHMRLFIKKLKS